jgi:hypothetical protein
MIGFHTAIAGAMWIVLGVALASALLGWRLRRHRSRRGTRSDRRRAPDDVLTIADVAATHEVPEAAVRQWIAGGLQVVRIGRFECITPKCSFRIAATVRMRPALPVAVSAHSLPG